MNSKGSLPKSVQADMQGELPKDLSNITCVKGTASPSAQSPETQPPWKHQRVLDG